MKEAVATFTDPATKQEVQVIPKDGESEAEAIARVKKAHGANPDLGEYQHVHDVYVSVADALKRGDKQQAISKLKELSRMLNEPIPEPVTIEALDQQREDRGIADSLNLAAQRRGYMDGRFTRTKPTQPQVPEPVDYDKFFSPQS